ncbi:MAG: aspartate kinase [Puniceicoccales bacterium]|jgi:aspartate kinase|nr:aspartate kinase [Puniceicoccales bacterium]
MVRIVQKYGGTSVANIERIKSIATRVRERARLGDEIIVIVSARAGVTNDLLKRVKEISSRPDAACLDALLCIGECETVALLAIILNDIGIAAVSRNAYQIGIATCSTFGNARIKNIFGGDVEDCLKSGKVVVVTGFQGVDDNMCPTTLGRGGSDLTALALAYRFNADLCEVYTDVDGVFSGDPRIVDRPALIERISHDDLLELVFLDSKVMQDRSLAFAKKMRVDFSITSSFGKNVGGGTHVMGDCPCSESYAIGLTHKTDLVLISAILEENTFGDFLKIFADGGISVSFIKHTKLNGFGKFLEEIAIPSSDFLFLKNSCFAELLPEEVSVIKGLTRIDVVGTKLEYSPWLGKVLSLMEGQEIFRSEYGKNGLSFLVKTDDYGSILNALHRIVFEEKFS